MAEQKNVFSYSGNLDNKIGYKRGGKYFLRKKAAPYLLNENSYKRAKEFGLASKASVLLRDALGYIFLSPFKTNLHNRLSKIFGEIIRSGVANDAGERSVFDGYVGLLRGFEFNKERRFSDLVSLETRFKKIDKEIWVDLYSSAPVFVKNVPVKAERVELTVCNAWIDFKNSISETLNASPILQAIEKPFKGGRLKISIPQEGDWVWVVMLTVCFHRNSSGALDLIGNKRFQAGVIAEVLHFSDGELVEREYVAPEVVEKQEVVRGNDLEWEELG